MVLKQSAASRSLDNITAVILGFNNFEQTVQRLNEGLSINQIKEQNNLEHKHRRFFEKYDDSQVIPEDFNYLQQQSMASSKPMSSPPLTSAQNMRSQINSRGSGGLLPPAVSNQNITTA